LTYWHGSKGQIVNYFLIWILYQAYVARQRVRLFTALVIVTVASILILGSYALFTTAADLYELSYDLTGYTDAVRNAMKIIGNPRGDFYFGRLTAEIEFYNRIPRVVMPDKPMDFGGFALAKKYDPEQYRSDTGAPNYDIGVQYADFGPFAIVLICLSSAVLAWFISAFAADLYQRAHPSRFIVFIFMCGVNVIPISGVFFLPETLFVAYLLSFAMKLHGFRGPSKLVTNFVTL
jgi:hypothetical protein